jgi:hypothetical protein
VEGLYPTKRKVVKHLSMLEEIRTLLLTKKIHGFYNMSSTDRTKKCRKLLTVIRKVLRKWVVEVEYDKIV